jgi:hypothetical protein
VGYTVPIHEWPICREKCYPRNINHVCGKILSGVTLNDYIQCGYAQSPSEIRSREKQHRFRNRLVQFCASVRLDADTDFDTDFDFDFEFDFKWELQLGLCE